MSDPQHPRSIRSFVTRAGRITEAQQRALQELWPLYGVEFQPGLLDPAILFGRNAPCTVEIGFGNGDNLISLAGSHAERNYLGIEVHRAGVGRVLLSAQERGLSNVKVICHDAVEVFGQQLAARCLDEVLILFPDPWPKKRHHKRRLIQGPFASLVAERLRPGGVLRLATDWLPYAQEMVAVLQGIPQLRNEAASGPFIERPADRAATRFERRGERLWHGVYDLAFRRI